MNVAKLDLNLLVLFEAMMRHRSVSAAARELGLSQPSMSYGLAKMRTLFGDPLFVRTREGMQPTPRASELEQPIKEALSIVKSKVLKRSAFDPKTHKRVFTLSLTDIAEITFLPTLLRHLAQVAPGVDLRTVVLEQNRLQEQMQDGAVDLAVGYYPGLTKAGFFQQLLFPHAFTCIMRKDHPRIGNRMTLKQFLGESHAVVRPQGRSHEIVEELLRLRKLERRIALSTPHFTSVPLIVAETDLIVTVPVGLAQAFEKLENIKSVPLPIQCPTFDVKQHWHQRFHREEEIVWLRKTMFQLFRREGAKAAP
ncbi:MAG: LysR family transcriptional regulator [Lautropia sp.]